MSVNYLEYDNEDMLNGNGIRCTVYFTGCSHKCDGCFNPETWDADNGVPFDKEIQDKIIEDSGRTDIKISGLSLLGGEPFENLGIIPFVKRYREIYPDKDIWCWSGYTLAEILEDDDKIELLEYIDVLIDGRFMKNLKVDAPEYRGSSNQTLYDRNKIEVALRNFGW